MLIKFSRKIFAKEWRKLLLPFLSVILTAVVISVSFFLVGSAKDFLDAKNKEFLGGDIVFESNDNFYLTSILDATEVNRESTQVDFNAILSNTDSPKPKTTGAGIEIVDENFPLYGEYILQNSSYQYPKADEVYLDESLAESLNVSSGDIVYFNNYPFTVKDIIVEDPSRLFSTFNFFGKAIFANEALEYARVDLSLFRKEYQIKAILSEELDRAQEDVIKEKAQSIGARVRFEGSSNGRFSFGLEIVERFLVIVILIISVLSLVNIYASVNYLAKRLRKDFAILISIGMHIKNIYKILFLINFAVITAGTLVGIAIGYLSTNIIEGYIARNFELPLLNNAGALDMTFLGLSIIITSIFATFPILGRMRTISPRELLSHGGSYTQKKTSRNIIFDVMVGILPITFFAVYFLESFSNGITAVVLIVALYALVMLAYHYIVIFFYANREKFSFGTRLIISQKKFDGFFGLISFASLFVALIAVFNLSIVRASIEKFLTDDIRDTLPNTYIIDIQGSQKEALESEFPEITLFPNVRARILKIDNTNIQEALENPDSGIDRELGREFNLTYRQNLLSSEKISSGKFENFSSGEVSVEKEFADRAGIELNSEIVFLIQGFEVKSKVTSIREVDMRSGLPFFYFVLPTVDLAKFPATFFGYAQNEASELSAYLATNAPNASIINTKNITDLAGKIVRFLIIIILMITIPPLLLSSFLIITLLYASAKERKRDGARLMALGKTLHYARNYYILESLTTTIFAGALAYAVSIAISNLLIIKFIELESLVYFEPISIYIFIFVLLLQLVASITTWRKGGKSLREYLNYEENN